MHNTLIIYLLYLSYLPVLRIFEEKKSNTNCEFFLENTAANMLKHITFSILPFKI